ncbi:zinc-ribbon domain-containing protein [Arthrobacter sp. NPDC058130]|uniref:zinc-ribbon domain-containing protein n=1 Tax=Arthrobacter sp. NPDC058130 TaxID=3346353 RepID=UPI0036E4561D
MLLLVGLNTVVKNLPGRTATCQYCGRLVHHHLQERATKFTQFFIPVLTTSRTFRITCSNCGQTSAIKPRQKKALAW